MTESKRIFLTFWAGYGFGLVTGVLLAILLFVVCR